MTRHIPTFRHRGSAQTHIERINEWPPHADKTAEDHAASRPEGHEAAGPEDAAPAVSETSG